VEAYDINDCDEPEIIPLQYREIKIRKVTCSQMGRAAL
jgi:hypothetical protein